MIMTHFYSSNPNWLSSLLYSLFTGKNNHNFNQTGDKYQHLNVETINTLLSIQKTCLPSSIASGGVVCCDGAGRHQRSRGQSLGDGQLP